MTNWFYNEVEMWDKQKRINRAAVNHKKSYLAKEKEQTRLFQRALVYLGRQVIGLGRSLRDRYQSQSAEGAFTPPTVFD
ncbi:MAG: hypothetical protein GWP61_01790 [Chloroflexi bacterium]|jgi:hypothetical protein|nr:hypothetical protein [Chloroflexota bacterium]